MAVPIIFEANKPGFALLQKVIEWATEKMVQDVFKVMKVAGQEYKRRVQRVVPRETGRLAGDWHVDARRTRNQLQVDMGTSRKAKGVGYATFLEFGTDRIANGAVKAWRPGMPVIMEWKAKLQDIASFRHVEDEERDIVTYAGRRTGKKFREYGGGISKHESDRAGLALLLTHTRKDIRRLNQKHERAASTAQKAFTAGLGEQMPFIRPIGLDLAPRIMEAIWRTIREGLKAGLDGKRF